QQTVQELPHAVAAQRDVRTDRHTLTQLELRDRLAGAGHGRLLTGDRGQVADRALDQLAVAGRLADTHVHDDLDDPGNLHGVGVAELLEQGRLDLVVVPLPQTGHDALRRSGGLGGGLGRHHRSLPERTDTRVRCCLVRPSRSTLSTRVRMRVGFLVSGSTTATLLMWIGASTTWMPPVFTPWLSPALVCLVTR